VPGGIAMVALVGVVPVDEEHVAIGAVPEVENLRPEVVGATEVGSAIADESRAPAAP
jgi:hypothetical protein